MPNNADNTELLFNSVNSVLGNRLLAKAEYDYNRFVNYEIAKYVRESKESFTTHSMLNDATQILYDMQTTEEANYCEPLTQSQESAIDTVKGLFAPNLDIIMSKSSILITDYSNPMPYKYVSSIKVAHNSTEAGKGFISITSIPSKDAMYSAISTMNGNIIGLRELNLLEEIRVYLAQKYSKPNDFDEGYYTLEIDTQTDPDVINKIDCFSYSTFSLPTTDDLGKKVLMTFGLIRYQITHILESSFDDAFYQIIKAMKENNTAQFYQNVDTDHFPYKQPYATIEDFYGNYYDVFAAVVNE